MGLPIQSKEVIDKISEELKVQPAMKIPRELADKIQLVYHVNSNSTNFITTKTANANNSVSEIIMTTSTERDTFLTGMGLSMLKDVNGTSNSSSIRATPFGKAETSVMSMRYLGVGVANDRTEFFNLQNPIKLERGTTITVTNAAAVATIQTSGQIYFYETDPQ